MIGRTGLFVKQPTGYKAFIPKPLPPDPEIEYNDELRILLSKADRVLARLDGVTMILPNPDLFIAMYVKKEALLSSQIEGTQASLQGVLEFEVDLKPKEDISEIKEVINYIDALNFGIQRLDSIPMSLRLMKELHAILLKGTRGAQKDPGEFRRSQNWITPRGSSIRDADFIPPPPQIVLSVMGELEDFIHFKDNIPPLIKIALIHAQFETIHPFSDGNGRLGRLLITFYLSWRAILSKPLLYLSCYFKENKSEYYEKLMKIRTDGDWEGWILFFLKGVIETSEEAFNTAREIVVLKEKCITKLYENSISSVYAIKLLDLIYEVPLISVKDISTIINISKESSNRLIRKFERVGILKEITGKKRYRRYLFTDYVGIISRGTT
ncbi:MAG: Fic family protein [candidate division Zixibacteria bacterium]|nr:Fic family protein [Candidatus Tariuqbacter arcticus]